MSKIGCKYPVFAPFATEPDDALPTYSAGAVIGGLILANLTLQKASGELYYDDGLGESVDEFMSGDLAVETDDMSDSVTSLAYGCAISDGELTDNVNDTAPYGGLAYYKTILKDGVTKYQGFFYPKVKATLGNDNAQTKGNSITFQNSSTSFKIYKTKTGDWRKRETFTTEAAAIAWVQSKLSVATWYTVNVAVNGSGVSTDKTGINYVAAGASIVITVTGSPTVLSDNGTTFTLTNGAYTIATMAADHVVLIGKSA